MPTSEVSPEISNAFRNLSLNKRKLLRGPGPYKKTSKLKAQVKSATKTKNKAWATLILGPQDSLPIFEDTFVLPVEEFAEASIIFAKALNGGLKEGQSKTIYLPQDEIEAVKTFASWMTRPEEDGAKLLSDCDWMCLAKTWVWADKYLIIPVQNDVIRNLVGRQHSIIRGQWLPTEVISYVYDNTMADSPLRKVFVDLSSHFTDARTFQKAKEDLPIEFSDDLVLAFMDQVESVKMWSKVTWPMPLAPVVYFVYIENDLLQKWKGSAEEKGESALALTEDQMKERDRPMSTPKRKHAREKRDLGSGPEPE